MKYYSNYHEDNDTEERIQVNQATCDNEDEIADCIERTKREFKENSIPYGYIKIDEQIITTVYKMPDNEIIHRSQDSNMERISDKIINEEKYLYNSEQNNNYSNYNNIRKNYYDQNEYINDSKKYYTQFNGGKIENYFENEISRDGNYLVSMTLSKKRMDKEGTNFGRERYKNNYYKEEIEVDENDEDQFNKEENMSPINKSNKNSKIIKNSHVHSFNFPANYKKREFKNYN